MAVEAWLIRLEILVDSVDNPTAPTVNTTPSTTAYSANCCHLHSE